ncbi:preprotein translocase subunit SecG [Breoghania sp. L-A4]|uniref:preprotein translocase subunit SecG n=1 Tax=Breoghania sp. L-A4 TaxID=2304600 RepID=UPI000E35EB46|nr:preprotein translocase subunit SecG [Breoghania sp. L-A4]AXS40430.1 preprotein translocase subunit SecG [Breoghania sp. L-A4]
METVIIVIHLMVVITLVLVVLLQRSEGGALGIGGGGGGMMSSRGTANMLTRATTILAVAFFATSMVLTVIARNSDTPSSILDAVPAAQGEAPGEGTGILDALKQQSAPAPSGPQVPTSQ